MATKATQVLEEEHRAIQKVAASLMRMAEDLKAGMRIPNDTLREISRFLKDFVEKCHQQKEEAYLFPILLKKGVPAGGCPLAVLNHEHAKERALIRQFSDAADLYMESSGAAHASLESTIHSLAEFLPGHIWKEDYLLLPMADKILSPEEQELLRVQFDQVESEIGPEIHHGFEQLAEELAAAPHCC